MSFLEPPTVLTRPPPSESPELPPSPTPSSQGAARTGSRRDPSPYSVRFPSMPSGSTTPELPCETSRDPEGRLKTKKRRDKRSAKEVARWREAMKEWKLLLTLENSGSVARDHLASERTFLAYARTSLTVASTGVGGSTLCSSLPSIVSGAHLGSPPSSPQRLFNCLHYQQRRRMRAWSDMHGRWGRA